MQYVLYIVAFCVVAGLIEKLANYYNSRQIRKRYSSVDMKTTYQYEKRSHLNKTDYTVEINYMGKIYRAIIENRKVYYLKDEGTKEYIGYYEEGKNGYMVKNSQGEDIGIVDKPDPTATISLSRLGTFERYRKNLVKVNNDPRSYISQELLENMYNDVLRKNKLIWLCAEAFEKVILDIDTSNVIAYSKSKDLVACSAGFVCLHYSKIYGSVYNNFYSSINY